MGPRYTTNSTQRSHCGTCFIDLFGDEPSGTDGLCQTIRDLIIDVDGVFAQMKRKGKVTGTKAGNQLQDMIKTLSKSCNLVVCWLHGE